MVLPTSSATLQKLSCIKLATRRNGRTAAAARIEYDSTDIQERSMVNPRYEPRFLGEAMQGASICRSASVRLMLSFAAGAAQTSPKS